MRAFFEVTKTGIVLFVLISGLVGYAVGFDPGMIFSPLHLVHLILGLYFLSSGSLALNQAQEWRIDLKMRRTSQRPIPRGFISATSIYILSLFFILSGLILLFLVSPLTTLLGSISVFLYNFCYTKFWKRNWIFAAVPGAIPGAMPVVIGYAAGRGQILTIECFYLFLVMFLWQMPHFWSLAIRFREDYAKAGIPTLPVVIGEMQTLRHIGLYTFVYIALALVSPWLITTGVFYELFVVPIALILLFEFFKYFEIGGKGWLRFFLWTNASVLVFLFGPVVDKWSFYLAG